MFGQDGQDRLAVEGADEPGAEDLGQGLSGVRFRYAIVVLQRDVSLSYDLVGGEYLRLVLLDHLSQFPAAPAVLVLGWPVSSLIRTEVSVP